MEFTNAIVINNCVDIQVFVANFDRNTIVYQHLNPPITARYLRIRPTEWINHISMRVELYTNRGID